MAGVVSATPVRNSMHKITPITLTVFGNEKAFLYLEGEEQSPDYRGFHRYRIVGVNRDGVISEYREDMGKASNFKGAKKLIHIPSLWEHTVDELYAIADEIRYEHRMDYKDFLELNEVNLA